jgi:hypothetical protein
MQPTKGNLPFNMIGYLQIKRLVRAKYNIHNMIALYAY